MVCNYGLFQLILDVINRFGKWCHREMLDVSSYSLLFSLLWFNTRQWQLRSSRSQLKPKRTCGFGIREKIRSGLRFFDVSLCGFAVFGPPLRPPLCKICRDDDGEDWVGCDGCAQYFHAKCLGVSYSEVLSQPFFFCPHWQPVLELIALWTSRRLFVLLDGLFVLTRVLIPFVNSWSSNQLFWTRHDNI